MNALGPRVILAADELDYDQCVVLINGIGRRLFAVKIHNLWDQLGPSIVHRLKAAGVSRVWVDLKLHDIPKTVAKRAAAVNAAGADIVSVHASGGVEMMRAAVANGPPNVFGITVLTSLSAPEAEEIYGLPILDQVQYLSRLARDAGVAGIVCSPKEVGTLAGNEELKLASNGISLVTPGIRMAGTDAQDQKRFDTPKATIMAGSRYLVIGSNLTSAKDPVAALDAIEAEIAEADAELEKGGAK